jgi:alpha-tubulin suppressor-like RCC1 family protein
LWCWGDGVLVGADEEGDVVEPAEVEPGTRWRTVRVGHDQACGIRDDGTLWCWGRNRFGERGDGGGGRDRASRVARVEGMP